MRAVDRLSLPSAPKVLTREGEKGLEELAKVRAHRADPATRNKAFSYAAYKHAEVKAALEALFHGKCAYCESIYRFQAPVDVEHYRPKGAVEGDETHSGYWWLAMRWENLLPSCIDCNRRRKQVTPQPGDSLVALHEQATKIVNTGKKDAFPIAGARASAEDADLAAEQAYLLDPTIDDPDEHLVYHIDPIKPTGLVLPRALDGGGGGALPALGGAAAIAGAAAAAGLSVRGAVSIQVYGLNRLGLVQERARLQRQLEFMRHLIGEIDTIAASVAKSRAKWAKDAATRLDELIDAIIRQIASMAEPDQPYSAMVRQWIRRYTDELTPRN